MTLPWRRPRHDLALLALVSVAALSPVLNLSVLDVTGAAVVVFACATAALVLSWPRPGGGRR